LFHGHLASGLVALARGMKRAAALGSVLAEAIEQGLIRQSAPVREG